MLTIPFRNAEFGKNFYVEKNGATALIPYQIGDYEQEGITFSVAEEERNGVLKIGVTVKAAFPIAVTRLGFRLGIDTYMDTFPRWNDKYFPTALRCEKQGFWGCFMSPVEKMIAACSPSTIVSWPNEYAKLDCDYVGHRMRHL